MIEEQSDATGIGADALGLEDKRCQDFRIGVSNKGMSDLKGILACGGKIFEELVDFDGGDLGIGEELVAEQCGLKAVKVVADGPVVSAFPLEHGNAVDGKQIGEFALGPALGFADGFEHEAGFGLFARGPERGDHGGGG